MEEEIKHIDELIATYLTERLEGDALKELERWIALSSENEKYFLRQREVWFSAISTKEYAIYNKEKAFEVFKSRISDSPQKSTASVRKQLRFISFWRYAAVITALCAISYFSYWRGGEGVKNNFSEITVEAPFGSRTKLFLPDGTLVWLNAGSSMTYSQGFGVDDRSVKLVGEGYFEVKRNKELPFSVRTKDLKVQVLGTKFNFRDYPDDTEVIVSLLEGKVALDNLIKKEKEIILTPNERAVLDKKSGRIITNKTMATNALQWANGYLFFDEELLPNIAKELERSYNVKIQIANDTLNSFRFYGNFVRREQSINEVLEALSATNKIHYKIEETNVILY